MTDDMPTWLNDPDDPRRRAVEQFADGFAARLDHPDGLECLMRWDAGSAALLVSKAGGIMFVDLTETGIVVRGE